MSEKPKKPKQIHDPAWNTSLYNHGRIAKELPLIPNVEYKQLYDRIVSGEHELWSIYQTLYSFEPKQIKMIEDIIYNRIV